MQAVFVLPGGGANGAYQAGVLYELLLAGIKPVAVHCVSVGIFNGIAVAQGEPEVLRSEWSRVTERDVYRKRSGVSLAWHLLKPFGRKGDALHDGRPMRDLLARVFDPTKVQCPLYAGTVSMATQPPAYWSARVAPNPVHPITGEPMGPEEVMDWMQGCATMPVIWQAVGKLLLADGGLMNIAPIGDAIESMQDTGAHRIIVIPNRPYPVPAAGMDPLTSRPDRIDHSIELAIDAMTTGIAMEDLDRARDVTAMTAHHMAMWVQTQTAKQAIHAATRQYRQAMAQPDLEALDGALARLDQLRATLPNRNGKAMHPVTIDIIAPEAELLGGHGTLNFERRALDARWAIGRQRARAYLAQRCQQLEREREAARDENAELRKDIAS